MQRGEKIAIGVSVIALLVSVINTILTSPVIINLYSKPDISVVETNRELDGDTFRTMFIVKNKGSSTAKNVELVLNAYAKDIVQTMQGFTGEMIEKPNGPHFKTATLKVNYLPPNDSFIVLLTGRKESLVSISKAYNMKDSSPLNLTIPNAVSIRSERSIGNIYNQSPWFQVNVN
ncbi:hypothetical protein AVO42_08095 [Thiomicrospira sp. XS5]|uniref:hypothetical protein n=1 Tax=Thiomicrospira sp. XS5 TaxID=1775636 RepID=UPI00074B17B2|nr:hypothetical protein [Thiomicrospira sp. XS5]KUJ75284.1 hypothetical protein AVO42_08095 [Thiomicrospira sp. XS5]